MCGCYAPLRLGVRPLILCTKREHCDRETQRDRVETDCVRACASEETTVVAVSGRAVFTESAAIGGEIALIKLDCRLPLADTRPFVSRDFS